MIPELSIKLQEEIAKLNPSPVVELFELDTTPCDGTNGDHLYFHNGTSGKSTPISFLGQVYSPLPIQTRGFELSSTGEPARPTLSIMNAGGFMTAAVLQLDDLIGAILIRRRTFVRFLDGEPDAAPVQYPIDEYRIVQKTREDRLVVEFELGSGLDLDGVRFPARTVVSSYCQFIYRGSGCRFGNSFVVADSKQIVFPGVLNFVGSWSESTKYSTNDTVYYVGGTVSEGLYQCIVTVGQVLFGSGDSPEDNTKWTRLQRMRGEYSATTADYIANDVVFLSFTGFKQFFIAARSVPVGVRPPNAIYWIADACGKSLTHCRWRFDPQNTGQNPLQYGAFPGTLSIPEV